MGPAVLPQCPGRAQALDQGPRFGHRLLANHDEEPMHHGSQVPAGDDRDPASAVLGRSYAWILNPGWASATLVAGNHEWAPSSGGSQPAEMANPKNASHDRRAGLLVERLRH